MERPWPQSVLAFPLQETHTQTLNLTLGKVAMKINHHSALWGTSVEESNISHILLGS